MQERRESLKAPTVDVVMVSVNEDEVARVVLDPQEALDHAIATLRAALACDRSMNPVSSRTLGGEILNAIALLTLEGVERP